MPTAKRSKKSFYRPRKRLLFWGFIAFAAIALIAVVLETTHVTDFVNSRRAKQYVTTPATPNRTINETNKGESRQQETPTTPATPKEDDKQQIDPHVALATPTGSFVSNHHPNLDGSPAPNELQSTCTTTSGATCQIIFEKGSVTKSLPAQQTDIGGSAYWSWNLEDLDLTEGSWKITAKAILGDQTKTATDSLMLEVGN